MAGVSKPTVVITSRVHDHVLQVMRDKLLLRPNPSDEPLSPEELVNRSRDAEGLIVFDCDHVDDTLLDACPHLRVVASGGTLDNIDMAACTKRGIWVTGATDLLADATAELAMALILALLRKVPAGDAHMRKGLFIGWQPILYGRTLRGLSVGIVGMGRVGQSLAAMLTGFELTGRYYADPLPLPDAHEQRLGFTRTSLDTLLAHSDVVVLALPLNAATHRLIDCKALEEVRPGACLVNVSRGSVVDESEIVGALDEGRLSGYAADVFAVEDDAWPDRPADLMPGLVAQPGKTVLTPRLGSSLEELRLEVVMRAASNVIEALAGRVPADARNSLPTHQAISA